MALPNRGAFLCRQASPVCLLCLLPTHTIKVALVHQHTHTFIHTYAKSRSHTHTHNLTRTLTHVFANVHACKLADIALLTSPSPQQPPTGNYQKRLAEMRLLGEMYNYMLMDSK
jgi:hypothetical protein